MHDYYSTYMYDFLNAYSIENVFYFIFIYRL